MGRDASGVIADKTASRTWVGKQRHDLPLPGSPETAQLHAEGEAWLAAATL